MMAPSYLPSSLVLEVADLHPFANVRFLGILMSGWTGRPISSFDLERANARPAWIWLVLICKQPSLASMSGDQKLDHRRYTGRIE
jgi:hypothetical protein